MAIDDIATDEYTEIDEITISEDSFDQERDNQRHTTREVFTFGSNQYRPKLKEEISKPHWPTRGQAYKRMLGAIEEYGLRDRTSATLYQMFLDQNSCITDFTELNTIKIKPKDTYE